MKVKWKGDADPRVLSTEAFGYTFPRDKWIEVPDTDHHAAYKLSHNQTFETDAPADKAQQHADDHNAKVAAEVEKEREKAAVAAAAKEAATVKAAAATAAAEAKAAARKGK